MINFTAEIGSNFNSDINRTTQLIKRAKSIGSDAIKFQYFKANKLYAPEFKEQISKLTNWELPFSFISKIQEICKHHNIKFGCSVFHVDDVDKIKPYIDFYKLGSYELLNHKLIEAIAKTGKPWKLSTGMATNKEIQDAVLIGLLNTNLPETMYLCNSNYPAKVKNCNLKKVKYWKNKLSIMPEFGWSDHTTHPGVIYKAISMGMTDIEFHFDLDDRLGFESQIGHCWSPVKIEEVINNVRAGEKAYEGLTNESEASLWRMDGEDGMRPMKNYRELLLNKGE